MTLAARPPIISPTVSVVSSNGETLDGLARYFEGAGVQWICVVLPKRCFGWDILDAIRAYTQGTLHQ
jgi:hypothetical protein